MNNAQFRNLLSNVSPQNGHPSSTPRAGSSTPSSGALGSRKKSSMPMTPRQVYGFNAASDFRRQLADQSNEQASAAKKFKSSAAPKGTKLGSGYVDRAAQLRTQQYQEEGGSTEAGGDSRGEKARRVRALEEQMKLGQISVETFEALRDQITGGDVESSFLVKGLDRKLLERARRGEVDALGTIKAAAAGKEIQGVGSAAGADEELEKLEHMDVKPVEKAKMEKRGVEAAETKLFRDAILAEFRAARLRAAEEKKAAINQPQLGARFKRLGENNGHQNARIERDEKGREVLITVDAEGRTKRKVRKTSREESGRGLLQVDKSGEVLGMDVPEQVSLRTARKNVELEDEGDIFEDAGTAYNPLDELGQEGDASSSDEDGEDGTREAALAKTPSEDGGVLPAEAQESVDKGVGKKLDDPRGMPPPPSPAAPAARKQNYFSDASKPEDEAPSEPRNPLADETILAALRKSRDVRLSSEMKPPPRPITAAPEVGAARRTPLSIGAEVERENEKEEEARLARRAAMLNAADRDMQDLDLGFGSSRFGDADGIDEGGGGGGRRVKLSEWKGAAADEDGDAQRGNEKDGGKKRRRGGGGGGRGGGGGGGKKSKGDKDSAADVLKIIEKRRKKD